MEVSGAEVRGVGAGQQLGELAKSSWPTASTRSGGGEIEQAASGHGRGRCRPR